MDSGQVDTSAFFITSTSFFLSNGRKSSCYLFFFSQGTNVGRLLQFLFDSFFLRYGQVDIRCHLCFLYFCGNGHIATSVFKILISSGSLFVHGQYFSYYLVVSPVVFYILIIFMVSNIKHVYESPAV